MAWHGLESDKNPCYQKIYTAVRRPLAYCNCRGAVLNKFSFIRLAVNLLTCCFSFLHVSSHLINRMSFMFNAHVNEGFKSSFKFTTTIEFWRQKFMPPSVYRN